MELMLTSQNNDLLTLELESLHAQKPLASKGKRFANLLIDELSIYLLCYPLTILLALTHVIHLPTIVTEEDKFHAQLIYLGYFISEWLVISFFYYFLFERFYQGRTLGKLCTRTRAVIYEDQSELSTGKALLRTLCRFIPFEVLSGLGLPWHDTLTMTTVISIR
jgi:uncharacterized RDD family membrane protein YckC